MRPAHHCGRGRRHGADGQGGARGRRRGRAPSARHARGGRRRSRQQRRRWICGRARARRARLSGDNAAARRDQRAEGRCRGGREALEGAGRAGKAGGARGCRGDRRRAFRRRPQSRGRGRSAHVDRSDQRKRHAGRRGRSAERHQRRERRGYGRGRQSTREHHVLPPQARAPAAAGPASRRRGAGRGHRYPGERARACAAEYLREWAGAVGQGFPDPAA